MKKIILTVMVFVFLAGNIRQIPLQPGTDSITIEGVALSSGIYYYSLYCGR
jgi:hypothetical protein